MNGGEACDLPLGGSVEPAASTAPPLPVQPPVVRAVRNLEAAKGSIDLVLLLLEHLPNDDAQIQNAVNGLIEQVNAASSACWHLGHLKNCQGQS